jgi:TIR domain
LIFISHTEADKPLVQPIAQKLASVYGQEKVFYDSWSIQPGDRIIDEMDSGLKNCKFFFFFVSRNSLQSKMVKLEWQNAIIRATNGEVKFIPVKLDDSMMPAVLLQTLYINFHNYGPETAIRQMIDVIDGRNIFREGETQEFQNIRAYISDIDGGIRIEFRAEAYMEPQSHYAIGIENSEDEIDCSAEGMNYPIRFINKSLTPDGQSNFIILQRANATSPGFPFVVKLISKSSTPLKITGLYRAISSSQVRPIPIIEQ